MTILILTTDPSDSYRLEQEALAAGALVFASGNLTEHVEVSNPYHHAAFIYSAYNSSVFGPERSRYLCTRAVAALCVDADIVLCPDEGTAPEIVHALEIPVVRKVEDIFITPTAIPEKKTVYCSGCERTGGNPGEACSDATVSCSIFPTLDEAMRGDV